MPVGDSFSLNGIVKNVIVRAVGRELSAAIIFYMWTVYGMKMFVNRRETLSKFFYRSDNLHISFSHLIHRAVKKSG